MTGAPVLAASGALRSGAGLVTVGVPRVAQSIVARKLRPEAMTLGLASTRQGASAVSSWRSLEVFLRQRKVTVLAAGPGLGVHPSTCSLLKKLLELESTPLVLDADGLNSFAGRPRSLSRRGWPLIVTPHPGEMGRLTGLSVSRIQGDRVRAAASFARRYRFICVLKGHQTVVTDGVTCYINTTGNPGMATGGSGDVLVGVIASLLAQKVARSIQPVSSSDKRRICLEASALAVFLHGLAGDIAAQEKSQMGLVAMDIAETLPKAIRRLQHG